MAESATLTLDPKTEARIRACVESGEFADPLDVVRAGLDVLDSGGWTREELRALIAEADRNDKWHSAKEVRASLRSLCREIEKEFT